jgi:alanyl-tRNA synthetase
VLLEEIPFYAERGGQVGDTGRIIGEGFELEVLNTVYKLGIPTCVCRVTRGDVAKAPVIAAVDAERRREIERAHTATHLLHAALRKVLGDYVKQEGSLVEPGRLRFDFAAFEPMTAEQIHAVERMVYEQVVADQPVQALRDTPLDDARAMGALAFFDEQYGERVTVVKVADFSMELCGGTHLRSTGQIGIRRVEALVGKAALARVMAERQTIDQLQEKLGVSENMLVKKVESLAEEMKRLEAKLAGLSAQVARGAGDELAAAPDYVGGVRVIVRHFPKFESAELRLVADRVREILKERYTGLLTCGDAARASYVVFVSPDLQKAIPAGKLAKAVGAAMGGGGGGRPDLAEGGGLLEKLSAGQEAFRSAVREATALSDANPKP